MPPPARSSPRGARSGRCAGASPPEKGRADIATATLKWTEGRRAARPPFWPACRPAAARCGWTRATCGAPCPATRRADSTRCSCARTWPPISFSCRPPTRPSSGSEVLRLCVLLDVFCPSFAAGACPRLPYWGRGLWSNPSPGRRLVRGNRASHQAKHEPRRAPTDRDVQRHPRLGARRLARLDVDTTQQRWRGASADLGPPPSGEIDRGGRPHRGRASSISRQQSRMLGLLVPFAFGVPPF